MKWKHPRVNRQMYLFLAFPDVYAVFREAGWRSERLARQQFDTWMNRSCPAFHGQTPLETIRRGQKDVVTGALRALAEGVFT